MLDYVFFLKEFLCLIFHLIRILQFFYIILYQYQVMLFFWFLHVLDKNEDKARRLLLIFVLLALHDKKILHLYRDSQDLMTQNQDLFLHVHIPSNVNILQILSFVIKSS